MLLVDLEVHPRVIMRILRHADVSMNVGDLCERSCRWRRAKRAAGWGPPSMRRSILVFVAVLAVFCCCTGSREALTNSGKGL